MIAKCQLLTRVLWVKTSHCQVRELRELFSIFDIGGKDRLSYPVLRKSLKTMGFSADDKELLGAIGPCHGHLTHLTPDSLYRVLLYVGRVANTNVLLPPPFIYRQSGGLFVLVFAPHPKIYVEWKIFDSISRLPIISEIDSDLQISRVNSRNINLHTKPNNPVQSQLRISFQLTVISQWMRE